MEHMTLTPLFSSFIVTEHLNIDVQSACKNLLRNKQQHFLNGSEPELKELYDTVSGLFNKIGHEVLGVNDDHKFVINDCWLNKADAKHIVEPHQHPGHILSAVYYVKSDPFKSALRFLTTNPIVANKLPQTARDNLISTYNEFNSSVWDVNSVEGMLIIFPSWMYHYVMHAEEERISLAFNAILEKNVSMV